jgi:ribosomal protein S13
MSLGVFLTPWLEDLLKIYLISAIVLIALTVNVAFRIKELRDIIVEHIVQAVMQRVLMDKDVQKIMQWKFEAMINNEKLRVERETKEMKNQNFVG